MTDLCHFLQHLHRGGEYAFLWTSDGRTSYWHKASTTVKNPSQDVNLYFGVHPTSAIPTHNSEGRPTDPQYVRSQIPVIAAIDCLYSEFDGKDFVKPTVKTALQKHGVKRFCDLPGDVQSHIADLGRPGALAHVHTLNPAPSVIVDSGGGYHAYWLLSEPFKLDTDEKRSFAVRLQRAWVHHTGGDRNAVDLARVLRLPGSLNHKYDPPRPVTFVQCDLGVLYDLGELRRDVDALLKPTKAARKYRAYDPTSETDKAKAALDRLAPWRCDDYVAWVNVGFSLCELGAPGLALWENWSQSSPNYEAGVCAKKWATFNPAGGVTLASLFHWANEDDPAGAPEPRSPLTPAPLPEIPPWVAALEREENGQGLGTSSHSRNSTNESIPINGDNTPLGGENVTEKEEGKEGDKMRQIKWTASELLLMDFPEMKWAIRDILPAGLSFLHGRPKVGKSWLALQIAIAVGSGGAVLDHKVGQGRVLYLALEDGPRRLQGRLKKQRQSDLLNGTLLPELDITFYTEWPAFGRDGGGMKRLFTAIEQEGYSLVVIDTLSRMLGMIDQLDLAQMTVVMGELQRAAIQHDVTILVIDHSRKNNGFTPSAVDDLMGSTGKSAVADAMLNLYKEQGKQGAVLSIVGRDFQEQDIALTWDAECCCWQSLGDAESARRGQTQNDILGAIRDLENLGELATGTNIARHLDKDRSHIVKELANLFNNGDVVKGDKAGREQPYTLNTTHTTNTTHATNTTQPHLLE